MARSRGTGERPADEGGADGGVEALGAFGDVSWSPRNLLVPYLLLALSYYRAHGYLLQQYLRTLGVFGVDITTIYRTLRQMERQGLVDSAWDTEAQGPARRVYSLTPGGKLFLESWAAALGQYREVLDRFFRMYQGAEAPPAPKKEQQP
jgi:PadR family transcriptional regulator, regulatory protein PadR